MGTCCVISKYGSIENYRKNVLGVDKVVVSEKRLANLKKGLPFISWNVDSVKLADIGYGDKPQFSINGVFKNGDKEILVKWVSAKPTGASPKLFVAGRSKAFSRNAAFKNAEKIKRLLLEL